MEKPCNTSAMKEAEHAWPYHVFNPRNIALGLGLAASAVILAPTILPALGIGDYELAANATTIMHGLDEGDGIAGKLNGMLGRIPLVGETLLKGGLPAASLVGGIGIGGWLVGNFLSKSESGLHASVGKAIKYTSLATSALMALPSMITAIGIGLTYMSNIFISPEFSSKVVDNYIGTFGVIGEENIAATTGLTGIAATIPHLLTCGASLVPVGLSVHKHLKNGVPCEDPYQLEITTLEPVVVGKAVNASLRILDTKTGKPLTAKELETVHTEKLHLFVVDQSLKDYQHIHPEPTGKPGEFSFSFTPNTSHSYHCFADITLTKNGENHKLPVTMECQHPTRKLPAVTSNSSASVAGLQCEWKTGKPLRQGEDATIEVTIRDKDERVFNELEPVMGAYAHLVGFSADRKSLIHCHPIGIEPENERDQGFGRLQFHVKPEAAGAVQFYLQIKKEGQDIYVPFGQYVAPSMRATERLNVGNISQNIHSSVGGLARG